MAKAEFSSCIEEGLLHEARLRAIASGHGGIGVILEKALRLYFANEQAQVWEKPLKSGWFKKLVVRPDRVCFETVRHRKVDRRFNPAHFTSEALDSRGWRQVWKIGH